MKKIKVLVVAGSMNSGGQENQLMHILRNVNKEKFRIDFTSTADKPFYENEITELGGVCHHIPTFSILKPVNYCKALYSIMKQGNYDVVHSNELFHSGIVMLVAKLAGVKCRISHSHSGMDSYSKNHLLQNIYHKAMRFLINRYSTELIACSTISGSFLFGNGKKYNLVFNSVDTSKFIDEIPTEENEFHKDGFKAVLHAGHIVELKNQDFLIDVADSLKSDGKEIHIFCAGEGKEEYVDLLKKKIADKKLEDYISFIGLRRDMPAVMKMADAFVLPSKFEGMPLTVIEAQASGLPCVCADTFSHEVDFRTGQIEWLSLASGADVWAKALERAIEKGRTDTEAIKKAIEQNGFDSKLYAKKITDIYIRDYERATKND